MLYHSLSVYTHAPQNHDWSEEESNIGETKIEEGNKRREEVDGG